MSARSIALAALGTLASVFVHAETRAVCRVDLAVSPQVGRAPLSVHVGGVAWGPVFTIRVNMGGENILDAVINEPFNECRIGAFYAFDHEFNCPGTYDVSVFTDGPTALETAVVTVQEPPKPIIFAFEDDSAHRVYLAMHVYNMDRPFDAMTVDWGDGNVQAFTWERRGLYMGTPTHQYAVDGVYAVTVMYRYDGEYCTWTQTVPIAVTIPVPTTPTESSTWGSVKALYLRR